MSTSQPNILMIMADQLPAWCIGAYGHPLVKTPNLDALAERGVRFESAYANCPVCAPAIPTHTSMPATSTSAHSTAKPPTP